MTWILVIYVLCADAKNCFHDEIRFGTEAECREQLHQFENDERTVAYCTEARR